MRLISRPAFLRTRLLVNSATGSKVSAALSDEATFALSRGPPDSHERGASRNTGSSSLFRWCPEVARFSARAWPHFGPRSTHTGNRQRRRERKSVELLDHVGAKLRGSQEIAG